MNLLTVVLPDGTRATVASLKEASKAFCARRDALDFGASNCVRGAGVVTTWNGIKLCTVSYNGRLWVKDGETGKDVEIKGER
jgi:hypothetical protein